MKKELFKIFEAGEGLYIHPIAINRFFGTCEIPNRVHYFQSPEFPHYKDETVDLIGRWDDGPWIGIREQPGIWHLIWHSLIKRTLVSFKRAWKGRVRTNTFYREWHNFWYDLRYHFEMARPFVAHSVYHVTFSVERQLNVNSPLTTDYYLKPSQAYVRRRLTNLFRTKRFKTDLNKIAQLKEFMAWKSQMEKLGLTIHYLVSLNT